MATASKRERILARMLEDEMRESFLDYSMSVIVQRALPDVRDGLKPVHRRILFAMHEAGLGPDRPYKKSATVVGDVLGKFHPHGDTAVYDALVRMVQDFSLRYPLVDGQGNFGSIDGDPAAAYRYTEARLARLAVELLDDIEKETVELQPNFDGQREEPVVLPARFPNLLVNGSSGIAVGMSTNVPPHNLRRDRGGRASARRGPGLHGRRPDAPHPRAGLPDRRVHRRHGRHRADVPRGPRPHRHARRVVKEALRGGKEQLVVTEIPYAVNKTKVIEQIAELARKGRADDISDIRDETDREGIRLVIELKRGADAPSVLQLLYRATGLQTTFGAHVLALDGGQPKDFDLKRLLERFRDHRLEVIQRRSRYDLEKAEAERHVVEGLLAALKHIDEVIKIIRGSKDRAQASEKLQERFGLSEIQAGAILDMRLARLTALERSQLQARLEELRALIKELRGILKSEELQLQVMLDELGEVVKKHGDARRTVILDEERRRRGRDAFARAAARRRGRRGRALARGVHQAHPDAPLPAPGRLRKGARGYGALRGRLPGEHLPGAHVRLGPRVHRGRTLPLPAREDVPESARASRGQSIYALLDGADRSDRIVSTLAVEDLAADRFLVFLRGRACQAHAALRLLQPALRAA
jgi:DNA gyrase subunit A